MKLTLDEYTTQKRQVKCADMPRDANKPVRTVSWVPAGLRGLKNTCAVVTCV